MHPAIGLPLERYTPPGGATLCGFHIPPHTNVGISAPLIHRNQSVYGADADSFRPERWLESSPDQLRAMDRNFFAVGFAIPAIQSSPIALTFLLVWLRLAHVYRQEHLHHGDGKTGATDSAQIRCGVGVGKARLGRQNVPFLTANRADHSFRAKRKKHRKVVWSWIFLDRQRRNNSPNPQSLNQETVTDTWATDSHSWQMVRSCVRSHVCPSNW